LVLLTVELAEPDFQIIRTRTAIPSSRVRDINAAAYYDFHSAVCEAIDNSIQYTNTNTGDRIIELQLTPEVNHSFVSYCMVTDLFFGEVLRREG
jgi:hypothetical protein